MAVNTSLFLFHYSSGYAEIKRPLYNYKNIRLGNPAAEILHQISIKARIIPLTTRVRINFVEQKEVNMVNEAFPQEGAEFKSSCNLQKAASQRLPKTYSN